MPSSYERVKAWRKANPEKVAAQHQRYRERHPNKVREKALRHKKLHLEEVRARDREGQARRRAADPDGQKRRYREWRERKETRQEAEAGRPKPESCELCDSNEGRIVFDHCHASGKFRGWLCDRCNRVLGSVYDDPDLLRRLATYLEKGGTDVSVNSEAA